MIFRSTPLSGLPSSVSIGALLLAGVASAALVGCGDDTSSSGGNGGGTGTAGNSATGGNATAGGGGQGGGSSLTPEAWNWVDIEGSECLNGTPTGIGVNPSTTSDNIVFFLQGGNACFNFASCVVTANPNGYDKAAFEAKDLPSLETIDWMDRSNPANPLKDYTYVYIPYCSGDLHAGDADDVMVGNKARQFHGYRNVGLAVDFIKPLFPSAEKVLLTGVSAGGFGAALNYDRVATAFGPNVKTTLIDDCGPPMGDPYVPTCLQKHFKDTWGLDKTLPADCTGCTTDNFVPAYVDYILNKYPERSIGLISSEQDATIRSFMSFGLNNCSNINGGPTDYDPLQYTAGLEDLRDNVATSGRFALFLVPGDEHVFLDNGIGAVTTGGVKLEDWISDAIAEDPAWTSASTP